MDQIVIVNFYKVKNHKIYYCIIYYLLFNVIVAQESNQKCISNEEYEDKKRELKSTIGEQLIISRICRKCDCENPSVVDNIKQEIEKNTLSELNSSIITVVKDEYEERVKAEGDILVENTIIRRLTTESVKMPLYKTNFEYTIDNKEIGVISWINLDIIIAIIGRIIVSDHP